MSENEGKGVGDKDRAESGGMGKAVFRGLVILVGLSVVLFVVYVFFA